MRCLVQLQNYCTGNVGGEKYFIKKGQQEKGIKTDK